MQKRLRAFKNADWKKLKMLYPNTDNTLEFIASEIGCSIAVVKKAAKEINITEQRVYHQLKIETWKLDYIFSNYKDPTITLKKMGAQIGYTEDQMFVLLKKLNLKRPSRHEVQQAQRNKQEYGYTVTEDLGNGCQRRVRVLFHERV